MYRVLTLTLSHKFMDVHFSPILSSPISFLFPEIKLEIFKFIPMQDLVQTTSLVCREWNRMANDNQLWRLIVEKRFPTLKSQYSSDYKQEFKQLHDLLKSLYFKGRTYYNSVPASIQVGLDKFNFQSSTTIGIVNNFSIFVNSEGPILHQKQSEGLSAKIFLNYIENRYAEDPYNAPVRRTNVYYSYSHSKVDLKISDKLKIFCDALTKDLENKVTKHTNYNQKALDCVTSWDKIPCSLFFDENGRISLENNKQKLKEITLKKVEYTINYFVFTCIAFHLPRMNGQIEAIKQIIFRAVFYRTIQQLEEKLNNCIYQIIDEDWTIPERDESGNIKYKFGCGYEPLG